MKDLIWLELSVEQTSPGHDSEAHVWSHGVDNCGRAAHHGAQSAPKFPFLEIFDLPPHKRGNVTSPPDGNVSPLS